MGTCRSISSKYCGIDFCKSRMGRFIFKYFDEQVENENADYTECAVSDPWGQSENLYTPKNWETDIAFFKGFVLCMELSNYENKDIEEIKGIINSFENKCPIRVCMDF